MYNNFEEKALVKLSCNFVKLRKEKGYTQEKLAELTGYCREYIAKVETGKRNVSLKLLIRTLNALKHNLVSPAFSDDSSSPKNWGSPFQGATLKISLTPSVLS
ncbi:MAG: helix-turn-helix domain-containing protein [Candidatus Gastranaerophilales bacterium]|nr:helix-turn-helix domain-containing protein [Candidatus Gastranaerophilales bacterium]